MAYELRGTYHDTRRCRALQRERGRPTRTADPGGDPCSRCVDDAGTDGDEDEDTEQPETCETVKTDGEVCGRDLPCSYHS